MRMSRLILVLAVVASLALVMTPGHAAKNEDCALAGSVTLNGPANLLTTAYGTGSFAPSSLLRCAGPVSGSGKAGSSSFNFCQHDATGPNPACGNDTSTGVNQTLDPVYDKINKGQAKIVAHAIGQASFGGFTGGVSCTLTFDGDATGTAALLNIKTFQCSNGFKAKSIGNAIALAIPIINSVSGCPKGPGNLKLCFRSLEFVGVIAVQG